MAIHYEGQVDHVVPAKTLLWVALAIAVIGIAAYLVLREKAAPSDKPGGDKPSISRAVVSA